MEKCAVKERRLNELKEIHKKLRMKALGLPWPEEAKTKKVAVLTLLLQLIKT